MNGLTPPWFMEAFVDAAGLPISGGRVYFFVAGSTVMPKTVYSDAEMTIPLSQPLVLDAGGVAPQYFMESGRYKVVVCTPTGDPTSGVIRTRDNVEGSADGDAGGPFLPLAGEKRVSGWVAFDATVYGTLIDMRVFNLTQSGLELKTGTRIYGSGSLEIQSSVYMDDPRAATLSVDTLGSGPGGVTPINSTHLVGRDPATGLLVPVELDIGVGYQNFNSVAVSDDSLSTAWFPDQPNTPEDPIGTPNIDPRTGGRAAFSGTFLAATPSGHSLSLAIGIGTASIPQRVIYAASGTIGTSSGSNQSFRAEFEWRPIQEYSAGVYNCLYSILCYLGGTPSVRRFGSFVWDSVAYPDQMQLRIGTVVGGDYNHARLDSVVVEKVSATDFSSDRLGTTTNDSAPDGCVGELLSSIIPIESHVSLISGTDKDVTSLTLGPGNWGVWGVVVHDPESTATYSSPGITGSISLAANTRDIVVMDGTGYAAGSLTKQNMVPPYRPVLVASGSMTAVHLVAAANFSSGNSYVYGNLYARRVR